MLTVCMDVPSKGTDYMIISESLNAQLQFGKTLEDLFEMKKQVLECLAAKDMTRELGDLDLSKNSKSWITRMTVRKSTYT